ncbi:MAG: DUF1294 domain-containing protein [Firmicutes bacterium]|nr:DUF1294 domain-containing protein [Bacillota bacterium]
MAIDKFKAVHSQWRIKENSLFSISLLGGCIGGFLGMSVFHHNTKKPKYYIVYTISLIIHIALIYFLLYVMGGDIV